ncbi:MAG: outer membrane lipoprotein-sorting protein [Brevinematia bacterium]
MKIKFFLTLMLFLTINLFSMTGEEILRKVDRNLNFKTAVMIMRMEIHLPDQPVRTKKLKSWIEGNKNSYVEFLNKEDKHTRYLKLGKQMWVYDAEENNTFLISGHLLKQGMMGSDISYEDALESDEIYERYNIELAGEEKIEDRDCYVVVLTAKVKEVNYYKRKMWIDKEYFVPLKEERYAISDKLLKVFESKDIKFYKDRAYATRSVVSDKLKTDTKTVVVIEDASFDVEIPKSYFTRRYLER